MATPEVAEMREPPFKVGGIVELPYFVGRESELKRLTHDLRGLTQNYLILAPQRYGKSSLLHNLRLRVRDEKDLLVPYVNCREMAGYIDFYKITVAALLSEYERKRRVPGLWTKFRSVFKEGILKAARRLDEIGGSIGELGRIYLKFREQEADESELVRAAFRSFRSLSEEKNLKIVFLLDEFQEIAVFDKFIFNLLKKELDLPSNVRYFFSGSSMSMLTEIFLKAEAPLYLMVARHHMKPLELDEVIEFVRERLKIAGVSIDREAAAQIYVLTGGIPFYIQKLGLIAFQDALLEGKKEIGEEDVKRAFATMLDELDGEFEARWLFRFSPLQRQILKTLADLGEARLTDIATETDHKPSDISSSVTRLKGMMIIAKLESGSYSIVDRVFAAWLAKSRPR
jgi:AAA+ ATPase superfamily predicted ATPase